MQPARRPLEWWRYTYDVAGGSGCFLGHPAFRLLAAVLAM